jgi:hypothetical protein
VFAGFSSASATARVNVPGEERRQYLRASASVGGNESRQRPGSPLAGLRGGSMAEVALITIFVPIFFAVGFAVGVLIIGFGRPLAESPATSRRRPKAGRRMKTRAQTQLREHRPPGRRRARRMGARIPRMIICPACGSRHAPVVSDERLPAGRRLVTYGRNQSEGGVVNGKRYRRPSLHYRYEHYDPR